MARWRAMASATASWILPGEWRGAGHGSAAWIWRPQPEPGLGALTPRARRWKLSRYRAYQARLAGRDIVGTFSRCAEFLVRAADLAAGRVPRPADGSRPLDAGQPRLHGGDRQRQAAERPLWLADVPGRRFASWFVHRVPAR